MRKSGMSSFFIFATPFSSSKFCKIPKNSSKSDWELELGVIIGKEAKYINEADSQNHIAGYCVVNDLSERGFQLERSGQWVKGKSCDTFGPIGPYILTKEELNQFISWHKINLYNHAKIKVGSIKTIVE